MKKIKYLLLFISGLGILIIITLALLPKILGPDSTLMQGVLFPIDYQTRVDICEILKLSVDDQRCQKRPGAYNYHFYDEISLLVDENILATKGDWDSYFGKYRISCFTHEREQICDYSFSGDMVSRISIVCNINGEQCEVYFIWPSHRGRYHHRSLTLGMQQR